jgi:hypothetical protein
MIFLQQFKEKVGIESTANYEGLLYYKKAVSLAIRLFLILLLRLITISGCISVFYIIVLQRNLI